MFDREKERNNKPLFTVGSYKLPMMLNSPELCERLRAVAIPEGQITFAGEVVYEAPRVRAFDCDWEVMLGAVNGRLYKIALLCASDEKANAARHLFNAFGFVQEVYGPPTSDRGDFAVWDVADGNVLIQRESTPGQYVVNVFLTSSVVKEFVPNRL